MLNQERIDVLGVGFNPMTYDEIVVFLKEAANREKYISFPDLYNIIRSRENSFLRKIYNSSTLTLSDGKPSQFLLKKKGFKKAITVSGYWLCKKLLETELTHFFYGSSNKNLELMKAYFSKEHPNANILGFKSPPIVSEEEIKNSYSIKTDFEEITRLNPAIIWIGISSPKQDFLMHYYHSVNKGTILIGVGAVFDYFAGTAYMGPEWLKKIGLRWLYQLIRDPKRYYVRLIYIFKNLPNLIFNKI